jgi:uncharacterized DUF497 family protein
MSFEWDEEKRESNLLKHRLDFISAQRMFEEGFPFIDAPSKFEGETRWLRTGIVDGAFVTVVWTTRNDRIRLISFRRARREERRTYLDSHI